ncbi:hypothetical protein ACWD3I_45210, partial [Streptomyces sp. NPDC002817]
MDRDFDVFRTDFAATPDRRELGRGAGSERAADTTSSGHGRAGCGHVPWLIPIQFAPQIPVERHNNVVDCALGAV